MKRTLKAKDGFIYTNGSAYGRTVKLGVNSRAEDWYEITEMEYEQILRKQEEQE